MEPRQTLRRLFLLLGFLSASIAMAQDGRIPPPPPPEINASASANFFMSLPVQPIDASTIEALEMSVVGCANRPQNRGQPDYLSRISNFSHQNLLHIKINLSR
jgi:hypothetical protein